MTLDSESAMPLSAAILKTLLYADIFDFPLLETEIAHYLIETQATTEAVHAALTADLWLAERVAFREGFYCLKGREDIIAQRRDRDRAAAALWPAAQRWGRRLAYLPFIRSVIVTGALAAGNPAPRDDIDYLIITAPGRLWLARALCTTAVRLAKMGRQRLCPNYLLAETRLALDEHNLFTARELAQMRPVYGSGVHQRMRVANDWTDAYLPQAHLAPQATANDELGPVTATLKGASERLLGGRWGARVESWIQRRKIAQLKREAPEHADTVVLAPDCCKGHFDGHGRRILAAYAARLARYDLPDDVRAPTPATDAAHLVAPTPVTNGHKPRRPTIGFDATALRGAKSGVGYYASNLLTHLVQEDDEHDYLLLSNRPVEAEAGGRRLPPRYAFPNRSIWMQMVLPVALRAEQPVLCHYTNFTAPLSSQTPFVVTIHDMTLSLFPRLHPMRQHVVMRPFVPMIAQRAAAIIAVSQSAKSDIVRLLGVPDSKVHVIYEAAAPRFRPVSTVKVADTRERYGLHGRYILYVGTIEPRKNIVRLVEAYARLKADGLPHKLLLVGKLGWDYKPLYQRIEDLGLQDDVIFLGYVPSDDLVSLFNLAEVFAFPSLYEGFGLPVIEAMACGTPVVTTEAGSLGEVAGDAALTVNPLSVKELADALTAVVSDATLASTLRQRGLARASQLSWRETARQTIAVYRQALAEHALVRCA
ncbi:MAG: glycosyltransferase family 1 protein [Anaerolineae bacterium]